MTSRVLRSLEKTSMLCATAMFLMPLASFGQAASSSAAPLATAQPATSPSTSQATTQSTTSQATTVSRSAKAQEAPGATQERWLHVRVENPENRGEMVRVNVPLEFAEKVLPTINHDRLHAGRVKIDCVHGDVDDVDLRTLLDAVRTAKEGEYVTVESSDNDIRVAKQGGHLIVHAIDKRRSRRSQVEIKIPMKVVDALYSAGKDELDLVAALHVLSMEGDTELVSVKEDEQTVRVWLDSKNGTF